MHTSFYISSFSTALLVSLSPVICLFLTAQETVQILVKESIVYISSVYCIQVQFSRSDILCIAPAQNAIKYETKVFEDNFATKGPYMGRDINLPDGGIPTDETDALWDDLFNCAVSLKACHPVC